MNYDDNKIEELVRKAITPAETELRRDLWPGMLRRMETRPNVVPWFDWALLAALAAWFFFNPGAIPVFLFHL